MEKNYKKLLPQMRNNDIGSMKMARQYVHLSENRDTAVQVGARRGKPIVGVIGAKKMYEDGHKFYVSANNVWLCEHIPSEYLRF